MSGTIVLSNLWKKAMNGTYWCDPNSSNATYPKCSPPRAFCEVHGVNKGKDDTLLLLRPVEARLRFLFISVYCSPLLGVDQVPAFGKKHFLGSLTNVRMVVV
eukprot:scaffold8866_cov71-Cylindrotheca_fusiformis.AAC.2